MKIFRQLRFYGRVIASLHIEGTIMPLKPIQRLKPAKGPPPPVAPGDTEQAAIESLWTPLPAASEGSQPELVIDLWQNQRSVWSTQLFAASAANAPTHRLEDLTLRLFARIANDTVLPETARLPGHPINSQRTQHLQAFNKSFQRFYEHVRQQNIAAPGKGDEIYARFRIETDKIIAARSATTNPKAAQIANTAMNKIKDPEAPKDVALASAAKSQASQAAQGASAAAKEDTPAVKTDMKAAGQSLGGRKVLKIRRALMRTFDYVFKLPHR